MGLVELLAQNRLFLFVSLVVPNYRQQLRSRKDHSILCIVDHLMILKCQLEDGLKPFAIVAYLCIICIITDTELLKIFADITNLGTIEP